ncbi:MAG: DNRLRE domain-containing protein [bacterium]
MRNFIYIITIMFLFSFCHKETEDLIGYDFLPYDSNIYTIKVYPDENWSDNFFDCYVNTGQDTRLLIGSWGGYRFRSLLYFDTSLLNLKSNAHITSAKIRLCYQKKESELNDNVYNNGTLTILASKVYQEWFENEVTWDWRNHNDKWDGGRFGPSVGSAVVGEAKNDYAYIYIDITPVAIDWLISPRTNFGIIFYAKNENSAETIKEFYSLNKFTEEFIPLLIVNYEYKNEKFEVSCPPMRDATIVKNTEEVGEETITGHDELVYIGGFDGYSRRSLFHFDLSEDKTGLPKNATIVRASLNLYFLPYSKGDLGHMIVFMLKEGFDEDTKVRDLRCLDFDRDEKYGELEIESSSAGYKEVIINKLIQRWIYGTDTNFGLIIRGDYDTKDSHDILRFASKDNANSDMRPYIEIKYTIPPE